MAAELHLAQGGIKNLREIVIGKAADFVLDTNQTGQSSIEDTLLRLQLSGPDFILQALGSNVLILGGQGVETGGLYILLFGHFGLMGGHGRHGRHAMGRGT